MSWDDTTQVKAPPAGVNQLESKRDQAYVITSVACDLRIGNVVDLPNYAVSTICPLEIFRK